MLVSVVVIPMNMGRDKIYKLQSSHFKHSKLDSILNSYIFVIYVVLSKIEASLIIHGARLAALLNHTLRNSLSLLIYQCADHPVVACIYQSLSRSFITSLIFLLTSTRESFCAVELRGWNDVL